MSAILPALSIRQPWAWLIACGIKDVENRTWRTSFRGRFLIHAGNFVDRAGRDWLRIHHPEIPLPEAFSTGGIIGEATLTDCVHQHGSQWFDGPWGFVIAEPKLLPFRPCRGQLGFFTP